MPKVFVALALLGLTSAAAAQVTVASVQGTAVRIPKQGPEVPLVKDATVAPGESIDVKSDGQVEVVLKDGSVVRLGPDSRLRVDEAGYDSATKTLSFRARMAAGRFWAEVVKLAGGGKFEVETDNGVAGVRGTEFMVEVLPGVGEGVAVHEGEVFFATGLRLSEDKDLPAPLLAVETLPAGEPARPSAPIASGDAGGAGVSIKAGHYLRIVRGTMVRWRLGREDSPFGRWVRERQKIRHGGLKDRTDRVRDRIRDRKQRRDILRRERLRERLRLRR